MTAQEVKDWRWDVRGRIDGQQFIYDGEGDFRSRHATVFQRATTGKRVWKVEVLEEIPGDRAEAYAYGDYMPLTLKMAKEIASRFISGRKIPKRLDWR